jgi:ubiquinone/menaquinone biosynthesis C-methylase UbiE
VSAQHGEAVRALFNARAYRWSSKYRGRASFGWRVETFARELARRWSPPARVLDFGCGTGDLARSLSRAGYAVTGCDIAESMIAEARRTFADGAAWVSLEPGWTSLPFADAAFDAILASSVLEYVPDERAVLREWARILRPGGLVLATVPDPTHRVRRVEGAVERCTRGAIGAYVERWVPRGAGYLQYLRLSKNRHERADWVRLAAEAGLGTAKTRWESYGPLMMMALA